MKYLLMAGAGYFTLLGAAWLFQDRLMFFPDTRPMADCPQIFSDQGRLHEDGPTRFYEIPTNEPPQGLVIYFHGNGGRACDRYDFIKNFLPRGYDIVLPEYPGYAERAQRPTEEELLESALASLDQSLSGLDPSLKVVLFGESLGTTVATYAAARRGEIVDGLILQAPFTSVKDVGQDRYFLLPVRWMLKYTFPAEEWARGVRAPVFSYHGTADAVVPIQFGREQIKNFPTDQKSLWEIHGAGHLNVDRYSSDQLWSHIDEFLKSL